MRAILICFTLTFGLGLRQIPPDSNVIQFGPAPAWTLPAPARTTEPAADAGAFRVIYSDNEIRVEPNGTQNFYGYRVKVLKPEGLAVGNVRVVWNPAAGDLTVHKLNLIRDTQITDVLKSTRFQVLQREGGLEQATLDGQLTAAIQVPGVQVGDELEFAATIRVQDPTLRNHAFGIAQLPVIGLPGAFRVRMIWPAGHRLNWKVTSDLASAVPKTTGNQTEIVYEMSDPKSATITDNAPLRFNRRRQIEYSDYNNWAELSQQVWPLYESAATLEGDSPLRQEAARIAAQTADPAARAIAALRLVQEQVRYVYVGLNGGNYRPATADETWKRRFGDCKAKTALLLALLRTLEVPAEATLVNAEDGDGIDDRLPSPSVFNHVLVRATLGEKSYWLDGTLRGNLSLANLPPPRFRWALPLRAKDATLVAVPLEAPVEPQLIDVVDIDATAGIERPARIKVQRVVRGAEVPEYRANLSNLPLDGVDRVLKTYWRESGGWVLENQSVAWRYDEGHEALILSMTGEGKPDWETTSDDTPRLALPGAGFTPPSELKRPKEQDQAAPWTTEFPIFHCWATTVRLPDPGASAWSYRSAPVDRKLGGIAYWRTAALRGNVMRTVMSKRFYLPEISAAEAAEVNAAIPGFDNKKSIVYQTPATQVRTPPSAAPMPPFGDETNWLESSALCSSPKRPSL